MIFSAERLLMVDVSAGYGALDIIRSIALRMERGRITTIAGPNGAGKSTVMKTLAGSLRPRQGRVIVGNRDVTSLSPPERARAGLGYVPQERNVFKNLTIDDNLRIGFEFVRPKATPRDFIVARCRVLELFPDLTPRMKETAGTLSGGQRQMLAMACALMPGPQILLLDEPSAGLSPPYVRRMLDAVQAVNQAGATVVMVEQNLVEAMRVSNDAVLLVAGRVEGVWSARSFLSDRNVRSLFLGDTNPDVSMRREGASRDGASAA